MNVLLSINPRYADLIFNGKKKYEYRKRIFKNPNVKKVYIYSTSDVKKIVGYFIIDHIVKEKPRRIWQKSNGDAGMQKNDFFRYFKNRSFGYAIRIKKAKKFKSAIDPKRLKRNFLAPQSFYYIDNKLQEKIEKLGS